MTAFSGSDHGCPSRVLCESRTCKRFGRLPFDAQLVAGVGDNVELNNMIFAADGPKLLDEPFDTEKGWEIIKVESINPERQKSMDEVRQQVMLMLMNQKSQDVQRDYIGRLMDEYNVIIHSSTFGNVTEIEAGAVK